VDLGDHFKLPVSEMSSWMSFGLNVGEYSHSLRQAGESSGISVLDHQQIFQSCAPEAELFFVRAHMLSLATQILLKP